MDDWSVAFAATRADALGMTTEERARTKRLAVQQVRLQARLERARQQQSALYWQAAHRKEARRIAHEFRNLPTLARNCLIRNYVIRPGSGTFAEVVACSDRDLLRLRGFGAKMLRAVRHEQARREAAGET